MRNSYLTKVRNFILLLVCGYGYLVQAQSSIDLFTISGFQGSSSAYEKPNEGKATESGGQLNLKVPIVLNDKTIWFNDLTYSLFNIRSTLEPPSEMLSSMRLHAFIFQSGIARKINERNGFQLLVVPRYTSDFSQHDSKNWQFGVIALYEHRKNDRFLIRYGALYNGELFGPLLVPLIYIDWQVNDRLSIVGMLPINLKVSYKMSNRMTTGFNHFGFITTYRVGQKPFETDYIERNSIDETLFVRYKMIGNLHIETRFGYSLSRVYEQYSEDQKMKLRLSIVKIGDERVKKNVIFDNGPIASVRLVYNLPIK